MNAEFLGFLKSRRSIRKFTQVPIPKETIMRILEAGTYAPSAHNKQPWHFIVVNSKVRKEALGKALTGKFRKQMEDEGIPDEEIRIKIGRSMRRLLEAPVIVLCRESGDLSEKSPLEQEHAEIIMDIQSVAIAGLQILLAAHAEGLGATWICWPLFAQEETVHVLHLPRDWKPQGMLFIGLPDEQPELPVRKSLSEVVHFFP